MCTLPAGNFPCCWQIRVWNTNKETKPIPGLFHWRMNYLDMIFDLYPGVDYRNKVVYRDPKVHSTIKKGIKKSRYSFLSLGSLKLKQPLPTYRLPFLWMDLDLFGAQRIDKWIFQSSNEDAMATRRKSAASKSRRRVCVMFISLVTRHILDDVSNNMQYMHSIMLYLSKM